MKKLLALLPMLALAGCNSDTSQTTPTAQTSQSAPAKSDFKVALLTPGDINDQGWNQLAGEGLERLKADGDSTTHQVTKVASDRAPALRDLADQGYNLIFCHGFEYGNDALEVGKEFQDTKFVVVAGNVKQAPNVATIVPKLEDAAYLCGMAAGGLSKTGKIGLIGGGKFPVIQSTFDAFSDGAKRVNPKIQVLTAFVGDFEDQNKGKAIAQSQIAQGADILFHNADQAGKGMFAAAMDANKGGKKVYVFGSNRNQNDIFPEATIGSAVIEMPQAFEMVEKSVKDGSFKPEFVELNLKNRAIQTEWNPKLKALIPPALMKQIEAAQKEIEGGKLVIKRKV